MGNREGNIKDQVAESTPNVLTSKISNNQTSKPRIKENHQIYNISPHYHPSFKFIKDLDPFASPEKDHEFEIEKLNFAACDGELNLGSLERKAKFPETFNPRKELNLPHKEKVDAWIANVPNVPFEENSLEWKNLCYDPDVPTTDEYYVLEENEELDLANDSNIINYQSKVITVLVNRDYLKDEENVRKADGLLIQGSMNYMLYNNGLDYVDYKNMSFDQQSVYTYEQ